VRVASGMRADGGDGTGALDATLAWMLCSSEKQRMLGEETERMTSGPGVVAAERRCASRRGRGVAHRWA
jgi:hypothetical protein